MIFLCWRIGCYLSKANHLKWLIVQHKCSLFFSIFYVKSTHSLEFHILRLQYCVLRLKFLQSQPQSPLGFTAESWNVLAISSLQHPLVSAVSVRKQPVYRHMPMNQSQMPVDCELAGLDFEASSSEFFWLKLNQSCP